MTRETLRFEEKLSWFVPFLCLPLAGVYVAAAALMLGTAKVPAFAGALMLAGALVMLWVALDFDALRTRVTATHVRVGFRWSATTIARSAVRAARAVDYDAWHFGGWGLRWNFFSGKRAYSVMLPRAVEIEYVAPNGRIKTLCVSSARPEEFARALLGLSA